jgi:F-type H+-transporting ATPase subunit b
VDRLGLNPGFLAAQIINFLFILFIISRVLPSITKMLDSRAELIAKQVEDARVAEQARANAEREAQKLIEERRLEGNKLVDEARARADQQAKAVLEEAQREAAAVREKALKEGDAAKVAALGDVRSDVIALAVAATERLVRQSVDQNRAHALISDFFSTSDKELKGLGDKVEVTSAIPLTGEEQAKVKAATGASSVEYKVDPAILGGLVVRAGDKVVDGSVRADLTSLAAQLK